MIQYKFVPIPCNVQSAVKIARASRDWFSLSLVDKLARDSKPVTERGNRNRVYYFRQSFDNRALMVITAKTISFSEKKCSWVKFSLKKTLFFSVHHKS